MESSTCCERGKARGRLRDVREGCARLGARARQGRGSDEGIKGQNESGEIGRESVGDKRCANPMKNRPGRPEGNVTEGK